jgi:ABC transport system ATP-binding/permease protein
MWTLETNDPSVDSVTFRLPPGSVKTIGRSSGAEFIVDAALVSRLHCQLTATADALQVKDLGSTNGTFVNGRRVKAAELREGDKLSVGRLELVVSRRLT